MDHFVHRSLTKPTLTKRQTLALPWLVMAFCVWQSHSCARLKEPVRPPGVPEAATQDSRTKIWVYTSDTEQVTYFRNGIVAQRGALANGLREGVWRSWSLDGRTIVSEGAYRNGRRDGVWRYYDNRGQLYQTQSYQPKPARSFGIFFHPDYGNENGPYARYFPDGSLEERGTFVGGYYEGPMQRHHRNGRVAVRGSYHRDQKSGQWNYYYPEGNLERTEHYEDGQLHGILHNYHPDGSTYQIAEFVRGKKVRTRQLTVLAH